MLFRIFDVGSSTMARRRHGQYLMTQNGVRCGKHAIGGGRRLLGHENGQAALVTNYNNPFLSTFAHRLRREIRSHEVLLTAVAWKLVEMATHSPYHAKTGSSDISHNVTAKKPSEAPKFCHCYGSEFYLH